MTRRPDFIIIGAMKCATSTLHEQLALQSGIFMSEPKEPNFFSNDEQFERGASWYASLFAAAPPDALCGESSTHYTKLPTYPKTIDRMRSLLGTDIKLIYIMRHPIDRLVSQYIHEWTQRNLSCPIDEAVRTHPELVHYSRYSMQLRPYIDAFGLSAILPMFFERLTSNGQDELVRVCDHIGYRGRAQWNASLAAQNASNERLRKHPLRDAILNLPGIPSLRRALVPKTMRDRIKQLWTMKERPDLSPDSIAQLTEVFDEDLAQLGRWLGVELSCDNFKSVARGSAPRWGAVAEEVAG